LLGGTEDSWPLASELNPRPPKYEVLTN